MAGDGLFDFDGAHIAATGDDYVLHPGDHRVGAVSFDPDQIAGVQPAVPDGRGGLLGAAPVPLHHGLAAKKELADGPAGNGVAVAVDDSHFDERFALMPARRWTCTHLGVS